MKLGEWNVDTQFNGKNFVSWKIRLESLLRRQGLWQIVIGEESEPTDDADEESKQAYWRKVWTGKDEIIRSLSDSMLMQVNDIEHAKDLYQHIVDTHSGTSWASQVASFHEYNNAKYVDGMDMNEHIYKMKQYADRLAQFGIPKTEKERVLRLLTSLPESWRSIVDLYTVQQDTIKWESLCATLIAEYKRRSTETTDYREYYEHANFASSRENKRYNDNQWRGKGHNYSTKHKFRPYGKNHTITCFYCDKEGQKVVNCPTMKNDKATKGTRAGRYANVSMSEMEGKEQQYSDNVEERSTTKVNESTAQSHWGLNAHIREVISNKGSELDNMWIIDSGCTQHMCWKQEWFVDMLPKKGLVSIADNRQINIKGVGTIVTKMEMQNGNLITVELKNVLFVPDLPKNLLSVRQSIRQGTSIEFRAQSECAILRKGDKIVESRFTNGLYTISPINKNMSAYVAFSSPTWELLHKRCCHTATSTLNFMRRKGLVKGVTLGNLTKQLVFPCDTCELATKQRKSFKRAVHDHITGCNDVVHSDVCGPIEVRGLNGERYVLLFVDVYSRFCKIFLLKERKEFVNYFEIYKAAAERRHSRPIKTLLVTEEENTLQLTSINCVPDME